MLSYMEHHSTSSSPLCFRAKEVCKSHFSEGKEPIYIGRGRLLWVDPGGEGKVKESNEKNNKAWTNFPPKGVDVRRPGK